VRRVVFAATGVDVAGEHALRCNMPVISAPRARAAKPRPLRPSTSAAAPRSTEADPKLAMLFSGRRRWVAIEDIPEADRHEYARLREHQVLDLDKRHPIR
jgi:hypothetical protein